MTIDEAIKTLKQEQAEWQPDTNPNVDKALGLGIEALKELEKLRNSGILGAYQLLPGETEE